ncbi:MAG: hydrogenase 3 maturation endopeptidase HyCI [Verrucomicrobia bacterium]|nr:hydrogenase 3 maturation endopeptidase HyCI [Verrucomicrobiota bacterium]
METALAGNVCILGVGNRMRGDDGAGSWVAEGLAGRVSVPVFDGGMAPENYLEKIAALRPDTVLIVDAVDFGGSPGELRLFRAEDVGPGGLSTHALSLSLAAEYLRTRGPATVRLLAIQPADTGLGRPPSEAVCRAVERAVRMLKNILPLSAGS